MSLRLKFVLASILSVVALALTTIPARAATAPPPKQGIQISPVLIDLNAEKANHYNLVITVTNVTNGDLVLKGQVNDFKAKNESGDPEVILNDNDTSSGFSFKKWVSLPENISLKAKESKAITAVVNVPSSAEAGGHYGVIRFSGSPPSEANARVSVAVSVGVLVLTRVNGTVTEKLNLKDFYAEKIGKKTNSRASLLENGPLNIVERFANTGNVHVKPSGTITVKSMFGSTVATMPISDPARNVLPSSVRKFSQPIKKKWLFGRYTARVEANYGYTGQVISGSFSFWVIPYRLILMVLAILLLLFFLIRGGLRRYNRRIVARAMGHRR